MATRSIERPRPPLQVQLHTLVVSVREAYENMGISGRKYALRVLLPAVVFFVALNAMLVVGQVSLLVLLPLSGISVLGLVVALVYPKIEQDQRRKQIEERFHLFITHMTVLSTTNIDRVEIIRTLATEREYRALADELARIVALVDTWNQSLEEAARLRAKRVPSPLMADFLERMAYALGAGQDLQEFLLTEQEEIIGKFVISYENDLDKLAVLKELYLSMTLSTTFALVFGIITPLLTGIEPGLVIGGIVALFIIVQVGFLLLIHMVSPMDPVWYHGDLIGTDRDRRILVSHVVGIAGTLALTGVVAAVLFGVLPVDSSRLPLPLYLAIPTLPLLYPAWVMRSEEQAITERDESFGSFVRVLGAVESVKQSSTGRVLETLRKKDFGSLTENIDGLYARLSMRIDSSVAWRMFAAETGSYLIQKFSEMYVKGRVMGGDPARLGQLINQNFSAVINLRERRKQETMTIVGIMYGITATSVFAFFVGLEIIVLLMSMTAAMPGNNEIASSIFHAEIYDVQFVTYLLMLIIVVNALLSALMIRLIDRGHLANAWLHFVALVWLGSVTGAATKYLVQGVLTV